MRGMARSGSYVTYALRQLKSPLSNISSLVLAGLKSTGTFVIHGVTQGQMTDVHLGLVPWTTNTTPGGFDEQWFQKGGLKGALVVVEVIQKHIEKRLRQLEALLMAPTATIVVVALGLFLR